MFEVFDGATTIHTVTFCITALSILGKITTLSKPLFDLMLSVITSSVVTLSVVMLCCLCVALSVVMLSVILPRVVERLKPQREGDQTKRR